MKTYSTKATAKRALKNTLAKMGLELDDVSYTIESGDNGHQILVSFSSSEAPDGVEALKEIANVSLPQKSSYIRERSSHGGVCAEVWAIADEMADRPRKDIIAECRARGIAYGTARTQYQKWREARNA